MGMGMGMGMRVVRGSREVLGGRLGLCGNKQSKKQV